jgi:formylglycine-generating enzyme required for sulfatase activity
MAKTRKLNVFLSYASQDGAKVRELYDLLCAESWISVWFDKEALLPGMNWDLEIYKGLRNADLILACLSKESVAKEGYVQKEFKSALSYAEEKPDGVIFVIPVRLDNCQLPVRFQQWQWLDLFNKGAHEKLLKSLKIRAESLQINIEATPVSLPKSASVRVSDSSAATSVDDLCSFVKINVLGQKPFLIGKYPVTNSQYARFLQADDYTSSRFWMSFPKFNENNIQTADWGEAGLNWLRQRLKDYESFPSRMWIWKVHPEYWADENFGCSQLYNPVVGVTWFEANAYCMWLNDHWSELPEGQANIVQPKILRLPLASEWVAAAGGERPDGRYPWDLPSEATTDSNEIIKRANVAESMYPSTTSVDQYPLGKSPHGVLDMAGNVWEWQANYYDQRKDWLALHGGSWSEDRDLARVASLSMSQPNHRSNLIGFRVVALL